MFLFAEQEEGGYFLLEFNNGPNAVINLKAENPSFTK